MRVGAPAWGLLMVALMPVATWWALASAPPDVRFATWWPAAGVSVAVVALSRRRWWFPLLVVMGITTALLSAAFGIGPQQAAVLGLLVVVETWIVATVLQRGRRREDLALATHADVLRLLGAALLGSGLVSVGLVVLAYVARDDPGQALRSYFPAHLAALLVIVPVVLARRSPPFRANRFELGVQVSLLLVSVALTFAPNQLLALTSLPLPLLTWAAFRFGVRVVSWQVLVVAIGVTTLTAMGHGPFVQDATGDLPGLVTGNLVQAYLVSIAVLCLPLSVAQQISQRLQEEVRAERHLSDMTLTTAGCMIMVSDLDGHLLRVNQAATTILGVTEESLLGTPAWGIVPVPHRARAKAMFAAKDGSALPPSVEGRLVDRHGAERRVLWTTGVVRDNAGRPTHVVMTGLDVTAELNAAGQTEHILRAALDTAIVAVDLAGRITLANAGAEKLLARASASLVGTPFMRLLSGEDLAVWVQETGSTGDFLSLARTAVDQPARDWRWLGYGTAPLVSTEITGIRDHRRKLIGYLVVGNDVTAARARQQLLVDALDKERQAVERLRELDASKDHFVTTVSHELRTPVATIMGYSELLTDGEMGDLDPQQAKALEAINRNGERLVSLVDNLLALSGVSGDDVARERDHVDLVDVVRNGELSCAPLFTDRRLTVIFDYPGEPLPVAGEAQHLELVLSNLVSNAVKFTEDGGEVRCSVQRSDDQAVLEVVDSGMGIPEDEQSQLFTRFWRGATARDLHIQGSGLGLATVQAIVTAHRGTVTVTSEPLVGTTVRVALPLAVDALPAPEDPPRGGATLADARRADASATGDTGPQLPQRVRVPGAAAQMTQLRGTGRAQKDPTRS